MKKIYFGFLATAAFCVAALFTACSSDSDDTIEHDDYNAGEFIITNTTRGIELKDGSVDIFKGDKLKIEFKTSYNKNFKTSISVSINDGTPSSIIDKEGMYSIDYTIHYGDVKYTFILSAKYEEGGKILSASKTINVIQKYNVTIPYVLYMTPDLRGLVNLKATYLNENGNKESLDAELLTPNNDEIEEYNDVYTYEDAKGITQYTFKSIEAVEFPIHAGPLTAQTVPMLKLNIPYYRFGINTEVTLSYESKGKELVQDEYNIGRRFTRKRALFDTPTTGIDDSAFPSQRQDPMFTGTLMTKEQTADYLRKIEQDKTDVIKLYIDEKGNVKEKQ